MSTFVILLRNETIKTTRRLAFWVTLSGYAFMCLAMSRAMLEAARRSGQSEYMLPGWWARVLDNAGPMGAMFAAAIVILLIASEFSWRTARQNVIDGLSKEQWFGGKLLSILLVIVPMLAAGLLIMASMGAAATDFSRPEVVWFRKEDLAYFGGIVTAILGFASVSLLLATTVRNAGPALGAFFLLFFVQAMVTQFARLLDKMWQDILRYAPIEVFNQLLRSGHWYANVRVRPSNALSSDQLLAWGWLYIVLFVVASFLIFRKRDL